MLLLLHAAGEAEAPARSYAELSFQGDLDADGLRHGGRGELGWTLVLYTGYDNEACPLSCAGPSVPSRVDHRLESRMREIRKSGSEGGGGVSRSLPLSEEHENKRKAA